MHKSIKCLCEKYQDVESQLNFRKVCIYISNLLTNFQICIYLNNFKLQIAINKRLLKY